MSANRCPPYRRAVARPKSPCRAPERARSTHRARVDAGRSAEGQMSPALRALGRWRGVKVKLHYAYKVRNIGRVRPKLRCCAVAFLRTPDSAKTQWFVYVGMAPD